MLSWTIDETDVVDVQSAVSSQNLAAEGVDGGFAASDFPAGDAPAVAPLVGADHQDVAGSVMDRARRRWRSGGEALLAAVEQGAQHAEIGDGDVRADGGEDFRVVVAGEHGDRGDAAVAGGFHVVGHVADEGGFRGIESVGFEDPVDHLALVEHAGVGGFEQIAEAEIVHLALEGERCPSR